MCKKFVELSTDSKKHYYLGYHEVARQPDKINASLAQGIEEMTLTSPADNDNYSVCGKKQGKGAHDITESKEASHPVTGEDVDYASITDSD